MAYFPIFCDLTDREVLLIGGDRHIYDKLQRLQSFGARLKVLCPEPLPEVAVYPGIILETRALRPEDLEEPPVMVIVSREDLKLAESVSCACRERNIPVNVVDTPELCSFYFPSLIVEGDLTVGISTAEVCPTAAVALKERFRAVLPKNIGAILPWVRQQRDETPSFPGKRAWLRRIFEESAAKGRPLTPEELTADVHIST